uniref:Uncharacterized protein n=1 Tax=Romanomermis culicivorax TaxID=13658 RepID=A0A915I0F1_ROMCU
MSIGLPEQYSLAPHLPSPVKTKGALRQQAMTSEIYFEGFPYIYRIIKLKMKATLDLNRRYWKRHAVDDKNYRQGADGERGQNPFSAKSYAL